MKYVDICSNLSLQKFYGNLQGKITCRKVATNATMKIWAMRMFLQILQ